jgi:hypothetical protein
MDSSLNDDWRRVASTHNLQDLLDGDDSALPPNLITSKKTTHQKLLQKAYG